MKASLRNALVKATQQKQMTRPAKPLPTPAAKSARPLAADRMEQLRAPASSKPVFKQEELGKLGLKALQEWAYERELAGMTDEELNQELKVQVERKVESTTGAARDPEVAEDASWRLESIKAERAQRKLEDPALSNEEYAKSLSELDDAALAKEEKRVQAELKDATSGPHTNEEDAERLEGRLQAIESEQAQRVVDDPSSSKREYRKAVPDLSDEALVAEQKDVKAEYDETLQKMKDHPMLGALYQGKLDRLAERQAALDAEVARRGIDPAGGTDEKPTTTSTATDASTTTDDATTDVGTTDDAPAETDSPKTTSYVIQPGDTLGDIAWQLSAQNGGTPSPETVLKDILALNELADPNLIIAGETLVLPAY